MAVEKIIEESAGERGGAYEPPVLTRFGTIEEWTLGALDGINISIVL